MGTQIIAIGGGKGGIGKSVMCTNLAVGMALSGQKVVLIDTDFGASNLHALLGISNPHHGFHDFFAQDELDEDAILMDTGVSNLKFLSGAGDVPGSADIGYSFQKKIISFIKRLHADLILLDLGPGTNYNIIDFFNIGDQNVVLTTPEMTSVTNTFSFLKAALFRKISQKFKSNAPIQALLDHSKNPQSAEEVYEINLLREKVASMDPDALETVNAAIESFKPSLVINRVRRKRDLLIGENLIKLTKKYLDLNLRYLGYLIDSDQVRDSVEEMVPFLIKDPQTKPSRNLQQIIGALTHTEINLIKQDGAILVSKQIKLSSGWGD